MHHHLIIVAAAAAKEPLPPAAAELLGAAFIALCLFIVWTVIKAIIS